MYGISNGSVNETGKTKGNWSLELYNNNIAASIWNKLELKIMRNGIGIRQSHSYMWNRPIVRQESNELKEKTGIEFGIQKKVWFKNIMWVTAARFSEVFFLEYFCVKNV